MTSTTTIESNISHGLSFILSHFGGDNSLWPKCIAAGDRWRIAVDNERQALEEFYYEQLVNSRISPYPIFVKEYKRSDVRDVWSYGSNGIVPNFLFIDIDRGRFASTLETYSPTSEKQADNTLNTALYRILDRLNEKFHEIVKPTVLWTGNGYHIYLPVQLSGPSWCLGHTDTFMKLSKKPDLEFLRWSESYLSDGIADPAHYNTASFESMSVRIPGSLNRKYVNGVPVTKPVVLLQEWDGKRPYIKWLLRDFHKYRVNKSLNPESNKLKQTNFEFSTKWRNSSNPYSANRGAIESSL